MPELPGGFWYPGERRKPLEPAEQTEEAEEPQEILPRLEVETPEGSFFLTPHDTFLRTFALGEGEFDHAIHIVPSSERSIAIFLADENPILREYLIENGYPSQEDEEPDAATYSYFDQARAKSMDE